MQLAQAFRRLALIQQALHARSVQALQARPLQDDVPTQPLHDAQADDGQARQRRLDSAFEATELKSTAGGSALTLARAWALHEALRMRLSQARIEERELDVVEAVAFERLAEVLDVPPVYEHTARYVAAFTSSTLTWQGDFAAFRAGLWFGLAPALDTWGMLEPRVSDVRFENLQFERSAPGSDSELGTALVSGEVSFSAHLVDTAPVVDALELVRALSVTVSHRVQPVPTQYLPLRDVRVDEQSRA